MSALPPLSEPFFTRGNVPFTGANTTVALLAQFFAWAIKAAHCNQLSTGNVAGTRGSGSICTVLGSSNGVAAAMDGVDRWTSTFTPSLLVRALSGTAHSWIVWRNAATGYDTCLDLNSAANGAMALTSVKSSQGFTGGSTTVRPQSVGNSEEFSFGTQTVNTATPVVLFGDNTLNQSTWFHFGCNADGSRWWVGKSRTAQGCLDGLVLFWKGSLGRVGDDRNQWWVSGGSSASGRGAGTVASVTTTNAGIRRGNTNATPPLGGVRNYTYGNTPMAASGADALTGDYLAVPLEVAVSVTTTPLACGVLPDLHFLSGGVVASTIPSVGAQTRTLIGDLIVPCGVALTV